MKNLILTSLLLSVLQTFSQDCKYDKNEIDKFNGLLSLGTPVINETGSLNLKVIPNPVVSDFKIDYSIEKNSDVLIELFSLAGESLLQVTEKNQSSGNHSISLANKISLKNGMYVIKFTTDNHSQSINFIVER